MTRTRWEVIIILLVGALGVLASRAELLHPLVRVAMALPLVVFLPGYAVVRALAPRMEMPWINWFTLGLGVGLSLAALGGLFLHLTPVGITPSSWAALLFLITMSGAVVLGVRTRPQARNVPSEPEHGVQRPQIVVEPRKAAVHGALFSVSFVITIGAFVLASWGFQNQPRPGFVQLWMMPTDHADIVSLGVLNKEHGPVAYDLTLSRDSEVEGVWQVTLDEGGRWETMATVPGFSEGNEPLLATLTEPGSTEPVRFVTLWPDQATASPADD